MASRLLMTAFILGIFISLGCLLSNVSVVGIIFGGLNKPPDLSRTVAMLYGLLILLFYILYIRQPLFIVNIFFNAPNLFGDIIRLFY